tara:strand:- start:45 stop:311 length:267 start_codon:yes stop_codon:yes gene_type:complete
MSVSATSEFINVCKKADKALREVEDLYHRYQDFLDKRELRKNSKVMEFLSLYQYDIYKEVFDPLYGGKPKKYTKRRRPKRQNKTRSKR